jgi:hypothetical protein
MSPEDLAEARKVIAKRKAALEAIKLWRATPGTATDRRRLDDEIVHLERNIATLQAIVDRNKN